MIIRTRSPLLAAILTGKFNAEPLNTPGELRPVVETLPSGVTRTLHAEGRRKVPHHPHELCGDRHCHSHHVDEPPGRGLHGTDWIACGECNHVFPTMRALLRDHRRDALRVYLSELRHPTVCPARPGDDQYTDPPPNVNTEYAAMLHGLDQFPTVTAWQARWSALRHILGLPFRRAKDVTFCPHCIHDL